MAPVVKIAVRKIIFAISIVLQIAAVGGVAAQTDPSIVGRWSLGPNLPFFPVHTHVLPTGRVMVWPGDAGISGNNPWQWDPGTGSVNQLALPGYDAFCSGHSFLADGRLFVAGGHIQNNYGLPTASTYNPFTDNWSILPNMNAGRWYPTNTTLANGDALVVSGSIDVTLGENRLPQVFQNATNSWRDLTNAQLALGLYPRMHLAPNGKVFVAGMSNASRYLDTSGTGTWTFVANSGRNRDFGSSVMYDSGKILIMGGGDPPTNTAEVIDLNAATPAWRTVGSMAFGRRQLNATVLPDGKVLVTGGTAGAGFNDPTGAVYAAEMWNPASGNEAWTTMASATIPRLYHSNVVLLPDGRLLSTGGNGYPQTEIYEPPYLFNGPRPNITSAPAGVAYGQTFFVETPDNASIAQVSWIRLSSATHGFNMDQRFSRLSFTQATGGLNVVAPSSSNLSPPGYYLLFILNSSGVPSVAKIIRIDSTASAPISTPLLISLSPALASAGAGPFTLTVNGSNFLNGAEVHWNGSSRATSFINNTQLTAEIVASDIATAGTAQVSVFNPGGGTSNSISFTIASATCLTGQFFAEYFNNISLSGSPTFTRCETSINNSWGTGGPGNGLANDNFSVRWTGTHSFNAATYTFTARSDDGIRVWLDGSLIIDAWKDQAPTTYQASRALTAGDHLVKVEYYEKGGGAVAQVSWLSAAGAAGSLQFSSATYSVGENTGPGIIAVTRAGGSAGTVGVTVSTSNGSATAGSDYTAVSQTISFADGETASKTVSIPILNDSTAEGNETVNLTLSNPTGGATIGTPATAVLTIIDDENPVPALSTLSPSSVAPGASAFTLTVNGSNFVSGSVVQWNGSSRSTTVLDTNSNQATASIPAADVAIAGTAQVSVFNPSPGGGTSNALTFTIAAPTSSCPTGQYLAEYFNNISLSGSPTFTRCETSINNSWGTGGPGNGLANDNFSVRWTGTHSFNAATYTFTARSDDGIRVWLDGSLIIDAWRDQAATTYQATRTLSAGDHLVKVEYYEKGGGAVAQVSWLSTAGPAGSLQFSSTTYSVSEAGGNGSITITRAGGSTGAVGVTFATTNGSATAGSDYTAVSQTINFADGDTASKTVNIQILNDSTAEGNETVNLTLSNPTGGATIGTPGTAVLTIIDDENPVPALSTLSPSSVAPGASAITLTVNGSNFVSASVLQWNGSPRTTTYLSSTQVTALIPDTDVANAGTAQVSVLNPAPGGGTSNALTFTIAASTSACPTGQYFAEYFNNISLSGSPTFTRCETSINNSWGTGGPGNGLANDNFSVRWTGTHSFNAATYTFTARSDDGIRVWLDGSLIIDAWKDQGPTTYQAIRTLTAGDHLVKVEYYEKGGGAVAQMSWLETTNPVPVLNTISPGYTAPGGSAFALTVNGSNFINGSEVRWNGVGRPTTFVSSTRLTAAIAADDLTTGGTAQISVFNPSPGGGISNPVTFNIGNPPTSCPTGQYFAEYFNNISLSGTPTFTACEGGINYNWGSGGPGNGLANDNFSVRWTGAFSFNAATYTFTARSDDGIRVWLDGILIIDAWKDQGVTTYQAIRTLTAGDHLVKVEYYEKGVSAVAQVSW